MAIYGQKLSGGLRMIIEKYGKIPHQNDYYGERVVCRNCGSRLIIQEDDDVTYDGRENRHYLYLGDRIKFECPFCCDEHYKYTRGVIYKNHFCEFLDKHDRLCAVIDWFDGYGVAMLISILVLAGMIFGVWWLIDTDHKLDEKYRYQINVHHAKYSDTYRTNSYTMGDDYIDFYIKDDPEKHMIVMKGDNVTIVDHFNKEGE
jgi:hypothetical protein